MAKKQAKKLAAKKGAAKKGAPKKATAKTAAFEPVAATLNAPARGSHPDRRLPCWNDDTHEILCKWNDAANEYHCDKVPIGGDFEDA
jgi:hypothetical protein